jgi:hypothetical protein
MKVMQGHACHERSNRRNVAQSTAQATIGLLRGFGKIYELCKLFINFASATLRVKAQEQIVTKACQKLMVHVGSVF